MRAPRRLLLLSTVILFGCASVPPIDAVAARPAPPAAIRFAVDTFAFPNESRSKNRGKPDLYANYCFVMVRAVTQFHRFARFDPAGPRLSSEQYADRVARVVSLAPWKDPLPADDRIVIPGYASLHTLSRAEEKAVKAGLGSAFWTWVHWTNWRVVFPMPGSELGQRFPRDSLLQFLVTNFPRREVRHEELHGAPGSELGQRFPRDSLN